MPSFNIHLAVGKRYNDKNKLIDIDSFYNGIVDPDLASNKDLSHYTGERVDKTLDTYLKNKVILKDYLLKNNINSDYDKGVFLHLITDYVFFNNFFPIEYLNNTTYNDFVNDLYYSYDSTNDYLLKKYNLDLSLIKDIIESNIADSRKAKNIVNIRPAKNILPISELDNFIESISNINLEEYKKIILTSNTTQCKKA